VLAAIAFILIVAAINARGIAESVKLNVVPTSIEVIGLAIIVVIGVAALGEGSGDFSRNFEFKEGESVFGAIVGGTALAFYAMIGFEDAINVVEETQQPSGSFPAPCSPRIAVAGTLYLRHGRQGNRRSPVRARAPRAPHAVRGDPIHDPHRRRIDHDG
jgi:basic amino acid/polyamine antiporter, APA family